MPAPSPAARAAAAALLVLVAVAALTPAAGAAEASPAPSAVTSGNGCPSPAPVVDASPAAPGASLDPCRSPTSALSLGKDGRLTVLVLGSDYRDGLGGERLDAIIVMSLDPVSHRMAAASIPRDTSFFPRARSNGGHTTGGLRVNALYDRYRKDGLAHVEVDPGALTRFEKDVEAALGVEIDHHVLTRFGGFSNLVDSLGGVRVDIPATIVDDFIGQTGALFPEGKGYRLRGVKDCSVRRPCHDPLLYARSRHGTVGDGYNSDFERSRRQQRLIVAGMQQAMAAGWTDEQLADLLRVVDRVTWTDLPLTVEAAREAMRLSADVRLDDADSVVFGPRRWAFEDASTPVYSFRLRVPDVRRWMDEHLPAPKTPEPSPVSSASPAP